jgi:hypothetical protein
MTREAVQSVSRLQEPKANLAHVTNLVLRKLKKNVPQKEPVEAEYLTALDLFHGLVYAIIIIFISAWLFTKPHSHCPFQNYTPTNCYA